MNITAAPQLNSVDITWREPDPDLDAGTVVSNITVSASTAAGTGPPVTLNNTVTTFTYPCE